MAQSSSSHFFVLKELLVLPEGADGAAGLLLPMGFNTFQVLQPSRKLNSDQDPSSCFQNPLPPFPSPLPLRKNSYSLPRTEDSLSHLVEGFLSSLRLLNPSQSSEVLTFPGLWESWFPFRHDGSVPQVDLGKGPVMQGHILLVALYMPVPSPLPEAE